jgi:vacuolar-type H+-ATPase subunit F/Vma7
MIVEIPGPAGAMPGLKSLRQSVEEAIGIHFDLKEEGPE